MDTLNLLLDCEREQTRLQQALSRFELDSTPLHVYQLGLSTVAPSPAIAKAMQLAAASAIALEGVASEAAGITDSLATLSQQAEYAVRRVRELDTLRGRVQAALDRVEDIIDLRQCLSGVTAAMQRDDMEEAALQVKRFRAIEKLLPVPEADVAVMREAETKLLAVVTRDLDAAILQASSGAAAAAAAAGTAAQQPPGAPTPTADLSLTITKCCQLMNVLGHADMGLTRFTSYVKHKLSGECASELRTLAAAPGRVDGPVAAINTLSSILARAAVTLESAGGLAASLFAGEAGPVTLLVAVHAVADKFAARLAASFARSGRLQAMSAARSVLLRRAEEGGEAVVGSAAGVTNSAAGGANATYADSRGVEEVLRAVEDDTIDAPFASPPGAVASPAYAGLDYSDAGTYDVMLDEIAIFLQRCASYARLLAGRAAAIDAAAAAAAAAAAEAAGSGAASSPSSAGGAATARGGTTRAAANAAAAAAAAAASSASSAETAVASSGYRLREASGELGASYSVLESATIGAGLAKAIAIDSVSEDGAQGASIDIMSIGTVYATALSADDLGPGGSTAASSSSLHPLGHTSSSAPMDQYTSDGAVAEDAGAGASISTLIEDAFYVVQKALKRAFATGNADCAASIVNHATAALTDVVAAELEARLRFAFEESGSGGGGGGGGASSSSSSSSSSGGGSGGLSGGASHASAGSQHTRLSLLRTALMSSGPVRSAAARLSEYQSLAGLRGTAGAANSPSVAGGGGGGGMSSPGGPGALPAGKGGALGGGGGGVGTPDRAGGGGGGVGGGGGGDGASGSGSSLSSALPTAKLTEEIAAASLALNDLQLAGACCGRLQRLLLEEATSIFTDPRELAKVRSCVGNLADVAAAFRRAQEGGISTLCSRLTPRLRSAINVFEGQSSLIQYDVSEEAFAAASEGLNAFVTEFLPVLASILAPLQYALTPALSCAVVTKVATYVSKQLEPRIRRKRFNQLGGIQFDADMRALVAFFVARSSRRVREKFTRLLQIAQLLNLESAAEVLEYWGSGGGAADTSVGGGGGSGGGGGGVPGMQWELSPEEVRAVLSLRVDFSAAAIAALRL